VGLVAALPLKPRLTAWSSRTVKRSTKLSVSSPFPIHRSGENLGPRVSYDSAWTSIDHLAVAVGPPRRLKRPGGDAVETRRFA
jgi:hypothetical protein